MQVILQTHKIANPSRVTQVTNKKQMVQNSHNNSMELSNFNSVGKSLVSFTGTGDSLNLSEKSIDQLKELKKIYLSNQSDIEKKKRDAQRNIDEYDRWNDSAEQTAYKNAADKEIKDKDLSTFWNPFQCKRIREKHYNTYKDKKDHIDYLYRRRDVDKEIVSSSPLSESQVKTLIEQIDLMIKQKIRQEGIDGVQQTINAMFNKVGGLNSRIAGYDYEKDEITKMFVEPLAKSIDDPSVKVPAAVLLHGATGTGKTTFLNGIGAQSKDFAEVRDLSLDTAAEDFTNEIRKQVDEARARYLERDVNGNQKKTRTILLINEAERFLSMTPKEASILYGENVFDDMDIEYMEDYGHNADYINELKSLLDTCSEPPRDKNDTNRGALTIFITSNYPHLIHPDLLSRDGKMPFIAINPARGKNIEAVIKHYFVKADELVEKIKTLDDINDIDGLAGISSRAKENIKRMKREGRLDKLVIDSENIPYDKFSEEFKPTMKKGAFSNDCYRKIAEKSCNMFLEDPSHTFEYYFTINLLKEDAPKKLPNGVVIPSGRDINPQRYKKFISIYNMLAPAETDEKSMLVSLEKMGVIDEKAKKRLAYIRIKEASELKNLEEKEQNGTITEHEQSRLYVLRGGASQSDTDSEDEEDYDE